MPKTWILEAVIDEGRRLRNWGRWGAEDQIGTLNFITPAKIKQGAALVRQGKIISCTLPYDRKGPQMGGGRRFNPMLQMIATGTDVAASAAENPYGLGFADDMIIMPLQAGTQWDGFGHCFVEGKMYNGREMRLVTSQGARENGIEHVADKVTTRGVLLDIPRLKGLDWLEPGTPVMVADLEAALAKDGISVGSGDALLVRTGHMALCRSRGSWAGYAGGDAPGLSLETAAWLHERELAAVATDTWGMEVRPNETPDLFQPLHRLLIPNMGLLVGEIFDLDPLAADCASDGVYEFFFVAPPLPFTGAVGSPLNAYAIK